MYMCIFIKILCSYIYFLINFMFGLKTDIKSLLIIIIYIYIYNIFLILSSDIIYNLSGYKLSKKFSSSDCYCITIRSVSFDITRSTQRGGGSLGFHRFNYHDVTARSNLGSSASQTSGLINKLDGKQFLVLDIR